MIKTVWKENGGRLFNTKKGFSFPIFDTLPAGWIINENATTAPAGFTWVNNNKSLFSAERLSGFLRK